MLSERVSAWYEGLRVVENPGLVDCRPKREQLVVCECGEQYRVWVNGEVPIADLEMAGVVCPVCGLAASEAVMVCGHSGGTFNAWSMRDARVGEVGDGG